MSCRRLFPVALFVAAACGDAPVQHDDAGPMSDGGRAGANVYGESGAGGAGSNAAGTGGSYASGSGAGSGTGGASGAGGRAGVGGASGSGGVSGSSSAGTGAQVSPQYLVHGYVLSKPVDCPEGYDVFDDTKAYYTLVTTGKASVVKAELKAQMMAEHPGQREYNVLDSSFSYPTASHAVVIRYTYNASPWNCRPKVVTTGLGKTYDEALGRAVETKNENFSKNMPHEVLEHVTWIGK